MDWRRYAFFFSLHHHQCKIRYSNDFHIWLTSKCLFIPISLEFNFCDRFSRWHFEPLLSVIIILMALPNCHYFHTKESILYRHTIALFLYLCECDECEMKILIKDGKKKEKEEIKKKSGPWITECVFHLSSFDTRISLSFYSFYSHHHLVSYPLTVNLFFVTSKRFQLAFIYPSPMEIRPLTTFFERTAERWHWEIVDGKIYIST